MVSGIPQAIVTHDVCRGYAGIGVRHTRTQEIPLANITGDVCQWYAVYPKQSSRMTCAAGKRGIGVRHTRIQGRPPTPCTRPDTVQTYVHNYAPNTRLSICALYAAISLDTSVSWG